MNVNVYYRPSDDNVTSDDFAGGHGSLSPSSIRSSSSLPSERLVDGSSEACSIVSTDISTNQSDKGKGSSPSLTTHPLQDDIDSDTLDTSYIEVCAIVVWMDVVDWLLTWVVLKPSEHFIIVQAKYSSMQLPRQIFCQHTKLHICQLKYSLPLIFRWSKVHVGSNYEKHC